MQTGFKVNNELLAELEDNLRDGVDICLECDFKMNLDRQIFSLPKMKDTPGTMLDGIPTLRYICDSCGSMKLFSLKKIVPDWKNYV